VERRWSYTRIVTCHDNFEETNVRWCDVFFWVSGNEWNVKLSFIPSMEIGGSFVRCELEDRSCGTSFDGY